MQEIIFPAPGSKKASSMGCTCPVLDNGHGEGYLGDWTRFGWVMSGDCPIHGLRVKEILCEHVQQKGNYHAKNF